MSTSIETILKSGTPAERKALFAFDRSDSSDAVILKFNLWARYFFPHYFSSPDAQFHREIDRYNLDAYRGTFDAFVDIAFRGAAKTARTKLFLAFCVACDLDHTRRFVKVLCEDVDNSRQIVTDIYNVFTEPRVSAIYAEVFQKTERKREETMASFTTATGVKIVADTVGTGQRGALQENARPDLLWFEDFENRKTLRSNRTTKAIKDNMEEARTGLAVGGSCIYTCNYLSETGNVHQLVIKQNPRKKVLIVPIEKAGVPVWPERFPAGAIDSMRKEDDDFEGERLCKPSASVDVVFDRDTLDDMRTLDPVRTVGGFKIFKAFNPSHRYGSGHDVAGGVGLDSSTSVFVDFSTVPAQVSATYKDNLIKPDTFGDEIKRQSDLFGGCIAAPERNNHGYATVSRCRQLGVRLFKMPAKETKINEPPPSDYGWQTNGLTKPKMLFDLKKAIEDGLLLLNDPDLIQEAKSYSRNDLIENERDPRLTTRHFDLLIAAAIAWQTKDFAESKKDDQDNEAEIRRLIREAESSSALIR